MTDKEEIIIDGVDVSQCPKYATNEEFNLEKAKGKDLCLNCAGVECLFKKYELLKIQNQQQYMDFKNKEINYEEQIRQLRFLNKELQDCLKNDLTKLSNIYEARKTQIIDEVEEVIKPYQEQIELDALSLPIAIESILERKTQECEELKKRLMQNDEVNTFFNTPIEGWSSDPCNICESKNNYEQLKQECEIWKKQVLILDEESVTVQVTQEQFEEYRKLKQELNFARNEVHQKTEYIKEQRDIIDQLKQECEELKEKNALLESQMAFNLSEMEIKLGNEINRSETLLKELKRFDKIKDEFREMSEKLKSENDRYRKALDEIEKYLEEEEWSMLDFVIRDIESIIYEAKGTKND